MEDYNDSDDDAETDGGTAPEPPVDRYNMVPDLDQNTKPITTGGKPSNAAPAVGAAKGNGRGGRAGGSNKRPLDVDGSSLPSSDEEVRKWKQPPTKKPKGTVATTQNIAPDGDGDADVDQDASPYCICHGPSYGEMIGCDNDNCEIEWVSLPFPFILWRGRMY